MNPRGFMDGAWSPSPRACFRERPPQRVVRVVRLPSAADVSEHGGYIFYGEVDFRSKTAERQPAKFAPTKNSFPLNVILENILIDSAGILLDLHFCVRLRFLICHSLDSRQIRSARVSR
jgi:hypothetical protein